MNKRGQSGGVEITAENVINTVIGVLVIALLFFLIALIWNFANVQPRQAQSLVNEIADKINYMKQNNISTDNSIILKYPDGWFLKSFVLDDKISSRICVCEVITCGEDKKRLCKDFDFGVNITDEHKVIPKPTGPGAAPPADIKKNIIAVTNDDKIYKTLTIKNDKGNFIISAKIIS